MNHHLPIIISLALACSVSSRADDNARHASIRFVKIEDHQIVFEITNNSKTLIGYDAYGTSKSFIGSSIERLANGVWQYAGSFQCGTMTKEEAEKYKTLPLKPKEKIDGLVDLDERSLTKGDTIRIKAEIYTVDGITPIYSEPHEFK